MIDNLKEFKVIEAGELKLFPVHGTDRDMLY